MSDLLAQFAAAPREARLKLHLARDVGPSTLRRLLACFGDLAAILRASRSSLEAVEGVGAARAAAVYAAREADAEGEERRAAGLGVRIHLYGDDDYPAELTATSDPPLALYVRGDLGSAPRCAIVGSRNASAYALRTAGQLAGAVAEQGVAVVSGLARGVDGCAHEGALRAGGRSIAVLACGLDQCYPEEHEGLARRCAESGAVVSEHPFGTPPLARYFPRRNRIVSGLSELVCVVAASERSGSLTTATWALEQGRDVFVVPHRLGDPGADGALRLLRDGAHVVTGPADLLTALGLAPSRGARLGPAPPKDLPPHAAHVLGLLQSEAVHLDDLCEGTGLPLAVVFGALLELERRGLAASPTAQTFRRVG